MKYLNELVEDIDEEIEGARNYAEKYVACKAKGNLTRAAKFKEMANDELKHATYLHEIAITDIEELEKVFKPTAEMQEVWDKSHKSYVDRVAWVRMMLNM